MKRTAQEQRRNNGKSRKQNKMTMEYGHLGENILPTPKKVTTVARWFNDKAHGGAEAVATQAQKGWAKPGIYVAAERITDSCPTCQKVSSSKPSSELGGQPWASFPSQRLQIDLADMPSTNGYKHLSVIGDQSSGWGEAFPTGKADAGGLVKT